MYPDVIARDDNGKVVRKLGHEFYAKHSVRAAPRRTIDPASAARRAPAAASVGRRGGLARPAMRAGTAGVGPPAHRPGAPVAVKLPTRVTALALALALSRARAFARASASARVQAVATANPMAKASTGLIKLRDQVQSIACLQGPYHTGPRGTSASSWGVL